MGSEGMSKSRFLSLSGALLNCVVSFIVFSILDVLDIILCTVYKIIDYAIEAEWKACYCTAKDMITSSGHFLTSGDNRGAGGPKVVRMCSTKLQLDDVSDTLYCRQSRVAEFARKAAVAAAANTSMSAPPMSATTTTTFSINSNIVEMIKGKSGGRKPQPIPLWSDCDCKTCNSWSKSSTSATGLYVHVDGPKDGKANEEDILFIHGFISSSSLWTETVFQEFTAETKARHRLFAVDLLGFGRSPKPAESLYTLREHIEMIEKSVLEKYSVRSFHIVAHSLGSIIALALAVKYPEAIKSLTLLAPPYFPVPNGEESSQYMMRRVAPRRVWPPIAFGTSMACWYEHVSRTICLVICRQHRLWDFLFRLITRNRTRTFLIDGFMCHTHNAAWHTLHNVICGTAEKMESYLDTVRDNLNCKVTVFHGRNDELLPVECSYNVGSKIPRARVEVFEKKDHVTIIVGQQRLFARKLEEIWRS